MQYGYFDDSAREYVITNPKTPVRWINYIGTLAFGGYVDQTGGALICRGDPALNRITRYIPQMPAYEFQGETLYLRVASDGGYRLFSPFFVPCLIPLDRYRCHVGLGYTRIVSEYSGLRVEVTIFVPEGEQCEIRSVRVTNEGATSVQVDAIPVVEYSHPDALKQFTNADWVPQTMQSRVGDVGDGHPVLIQYPFMHRDTRVNYFASSWPVSSFETDRERFLGDNGYGTWANPLSLQGHEFSNYCALRGDNIAALMLHLGRLEPGASVRFVTLLGQAPGLKDALPLIHKYRDEANVDRSLERLSRFWDGYLSTFQVECPDPDMARMLNIHNPRQCHTTMNWSRYLSLYQLGYGARGIGFRDSSQDVLGAVAAMPVEARALLRQLLHVQRRDGSAMHQFNPLTMLGTMGDAREQEDRPQYYSDDHLWAVLAVCAYLRETGELTFLDEVIPYYERGRDGESMASGSVMDHLGRAIEYTRHDLGAHGLPLLGFADWNDTVNLAIGAESLFTANLYGKVLLEMVELADYLGDAEAAGRYRRYHAEMKGAVNEAAWDGEWYISYLDAGGAPLGSSAGAAGKIYVTGQPWPVMAGYASAKRACQALDSVQRHLNTPRGIKLMAPAFNGFDPGRGGVTTYPPGAKENGGIFLHTNPWVIIAETLTGNGDRAFAYYSQINPAARNDAIEEFECEPYVYPQNILGDEHPQFGLARNSWLSGTASWMYVAGTQHILGIQPGYAGLRINPCMPSAWDGFRVIRKFRGSTYQIRVENPDHVSGGLRLLELDGWVIPGDTVPCQRAGGTHYVRAVIGR